MVRQFNDQTPVIHLPIHIDSHEVQNDKKGWVLLPTLMYKILLPMQSNRSLNLFQETILKLLRTGYKSEDQLARSLHLGIDLVKYVLKELAEKNYITLKLELTDQGRAYFNDELVKTNMKIGYIFYDLLTKQFWNQVYVKNSLKYHDVEFENNRATLNLGTVEKPIPRRALVLKQSGPINDPVIRAETIYQTIQSSADRFSDIPELKNQYDFSEKFNLKKNYMEDIKLISSGDPVYLKTFMYLPVNLKQNSHWQVLHPFGYSNSPELMDIFNKMRHQYNPLHREIDKLLKTALDPVRPSIDEEEKENYKYVISIFGDKLEKRFEVFNSTMQLVRTFKKVKSLLSQSNRGAIFDDLQTEFSTFVVQSLELIETALHTIQKRDKQRKKRVNKEETKVEISQIASKNTHQNLKMLHTYAMKCGFELNKDRDVYSQLLKMRGGELIHAYDNKAIKGLIGVALIEGGERSDYPIRQLAKSFPSFIDFIQELLVIRNSSAHITEDTFETNIAEDIYTKCMYSISVLFNTLFNRDLVEEYGHFDEASLMIDRKLRLLSKQYIENEFGQLLADQPVIEKLLGEMHYFKNNHAYHYTMKSVSVIEQLLNLLLETMDFNGTENLLAKTGHQNAEKVAPILQGYGFEWNVTKLPETFLRVNMDKVRLELFTLKKSVPNVKIYALFALMQKVRDERFVQIAAQHPDLFVKMIEIIAIRKHGHVVLTEDQMQQIENFVYHAVRVLQPYLIKVLV